MLGVSGGGGNYCITGSAFVDGGTIGDLKIRLHAEKADLLGRIGETGKLEEADEAELGRAIADFVDDFGPDFDEHGDPTPTYVLWQVHAGKIVILASGLTPQ